MSLIIKGMKLPKKSDHRECSIAVVQNRPASIAFSQAKTNLFECFECAEIPTPHGRLIDADELTRCIEHAYGDRDIVRLVTNNIARQPTIIEAEELKENS